MHVLAAFVIIIAFYSGFHPINEAPKNELMIATDGADRVKVRETVTSLEDLKKQNIVQQTYDYSCGSAALATLLNYHFGEDFEERQVIQGLLPSLCRFPWHPPRPCFPGRPLARQHQLHQTGVHRQMVPERHFHRLSRRRPGDRPFKS